MLARNLMVQTIRLKCKLLVLAAVLIRTCSTSLLVGGRHDGHSGTGS